MTDPERETGTAEHGREISARARLTPERRAIASEHGDLTFAELDRSAERLAGYLQNAGLAAGDVVALLCTNRPEWIVAQQAALRSGLRLVPVNWHLKGEDISYVIADSGAQALITEDTFVSELSVSELSVDELGDATRDIKTRIVIGDHVEGFTSFTEALSQLLPTDPQRLRGTLMIYTSEVPGDPKVYAKPAARQAAEQLSARPWWQCSVSTATVATKCSVQRRCITPDPAESVLNGRSGLVSPCISWPVSIPKSRSN